MQAGCAKVQITPPLGLKMAGWFPETREARGVRDELYCRVLVLQDKKNIIVLAACDLLQVQKEWINEVYHLVKKQANIPSSHILICGSHTHSGPDTSDHLTVKKAPKQNREHRDKLIKLIAGAIITAQKNLVPAKICVSSGKVNGIAENDRYLLRDKTIAWFSYTRDEIITPTGPVDPEVGVLHITDTNDRTIGILYNYSCHANICAEEGYSADYPGVTSGLLERDLGGVALFTPGACGNIHPVVSEEPSKVVEEAGKKLASVIKKVIQGMERYQSNVRLGSARETVSLPTRKLQKSEEKDIKKTFSREGFKKVLKGDTEKVRRAYLAVYRNRKAECLKKERNGKGRFSTVVQVFKIGNCALVGIPGEPFVEVGAEIKKRSPFSFTFIIELANDTIGYIPTETAFRLGGYQTWANHYSLKTAAPSAGRILIENGLKLTEKLFHEERTFR